jgi:hypothetical protein
LQAVAEVQEVTAEVAEVAEYYIMIRIRLQLVQLLV